MMELTKGIYDRKEVQDLLTLTGRLMAYLRALDCPICEVHIGKDGEGCSICRKFKQSVGSFKKN